MRYLALFLLVVICAYVATVALVNRAAQSRSGPLIVERSSELPSAGRELRVVSWNLGFAGLGRQAEFLPDGGKHYIPSEQSAVRDYLDGIANVLDKTPADVYALQEATVSSPLNHGAPVWSRVKSTLRGTDQVFLLDVLTRFIPRPLALEHGFATLTRRRIDGADSVALPLETGYWLAFIKKMYALLVVRLPIEGETRQWVIVNLHLAAYDAGGATRMAQAEAAMAFARTEYAKGNFVVLAGDWNMILGGPARPHQTDPKNLEWVQTFPAQLLSGGWQLAYDPATPSVRQLDGPYQPGKNFVGVIDGFVAAPNVSAVLVRTLDLGFAYSDHQPVTATFIAH